MRDQAVPRVLLQAYTACSTAGFLGGVFGFVAGYQAGRSALAPIGCVTGAIAGIVLGFALAIPFIWACRTTRLGPMTVAVFVPASLAALPWMIVPEPHLGVGFAILAGLPGIAWGRLSSDALLPNERGSCPQCGYLLPELQRGCPECGGSGVVTAQEKLSRGVTYCLRIALVAGPAISWTVWSITASAA